MPQASPVLAALPAQAGTAACHDSDDASLLTLAGAIGWRGAGHASENRAAGSPSSRNSTLSVANPSKRRGAIPARSRTCAPIGRTARAASPTR